MSSCACVSCQELQARLDAAAVGQPAHRILHWWHLPGPAVCGAFRCNDSSPFFRIAARAVFIGAHTAVSEFVFVGSLPRSQNEADLSVGNTYMKSSIQLLPCGLLWQAANQLMPKPTHLTWEESAIVSPTLVSSDISYIGTSSGTSRVGDWHTGCRGGCGRCCTRAATDHVCGPPCCFGVGQRR